MAQQRPPRMTGPGHDTFWEGCGKGEIRMQHCPDCGHRPWPVVTSCEQCGSEKLKFERVSGKGKLVSWCTFEQSYYGDLLPVPWDTIIVELDEGPWFISNPKGFTNAEAKLGMALKVSFLDCEDQHGAFALPVFEPA
ncbi:MAG: OB-fold domain-containing protein [Sphingomonadaceae bacterium]|nr:OB-fold domain-containing protein [Sphingomonadaceae bacterium]